MKKRTALDEALADAGDGAVGIDADGRIVSWNRSAEQVLGHAAADVVGQRCWEVFAAHDADGNRLCHADCRVMTLLAMREPVRSFDMRTCTREGRPVWLNVSALATRRDRRIVHLFRDVTVARELLALVRDADSPVAERAPGPAPTLSRRQLEILRCLSEGLNTAATAARLRLSPATVRNHVHRILAKLGAHSRLQAVAAARRHDLV
jgi:PAS domain S-box-containing protein